MTLALSHPHEFTLFEEKKMPLEIRKTYFTEPEIRKSLINFSVLRKQFLENNDIKKLIISSSDEVHISLLADQAFEFCENKINYSNHEWNN